MNRNLTMVVSMALIGLAIFFNARQQRSSGPHTTLLTTLHSHISSTKCTKNIVLGWNTCIDLLVNATHVSNALDLTPLSSRAVDHDSISSLAALSESLSHWFSRGGAAERLMSGIDAAQVFAQVVDSSNSVLGGRLRVGGNAALMATSLAKFGCSVHLGGPIGPTLAGRLDPSITMTSTGGRDEKEKKNKNKNENKNKNKNKNKKKFNAHTHQTSRHASTLNNCCHKHVAVNFISKQMLSQSI